jgi:hypothetical protein
LQKNNEFSIIVDGSLRLLRREKKYSNRPFNKITFYKKYIIVMRATRWSKCKHSAVKAIGSQIKCVIGPKFESHLASLADFVPRSSGTALVEVFARVIDGGGEVPAPAERRKHDDW